MREGRQPPNSSDVLTLSTFVERICQRKDINEWEKADLLSSGLERFLAWGSEEKTKRRNPGILVSQEVKTQDVDNENRKEEKQLNVPLKKKYSPPTHHQRQQLIKPLEHDTINNHKGPVEELTTQ